MHISTEREGARTNLGFNHYGSPAQGIIEEVGNEYEIDHSRRSNILGYPEMAESEDLAESVAVLVPNEVCSPGFVMRRQKNAIESFAWDPNYASDIIEMRSLNRQLFLKEEQYLFRTVIANKSFTEGVHYWEVVADAQTENELKIGVCKNRDFDLKTAFCDYSFGWAFYCNG